MPLESAFGAEALRFDDSTAGSEPADKSIREFGSADDAGAAIDAACTRDRPNDGAALAPAPTLGAEPNSSAARWSRANGKICEAGGARATSDELRDAPSNANEESNRSIAAPNADDEEEEDEEGEENAAVRAAALGRVSLLALSARDDGCCAS